MEPAKLASHVDAVSRAFQPISVVAEGVSVPLIYSF